MGARELISVLDVHPSTIDPATPPTTQKVWNWVMEPVLFGTIGTSIVFAKLNGSTIPKSVCVVLTGARAVLAWTAPGRSARGRCCALRNGRQVPSPKPALFGRICTDATRLKRCVAPPPTTDSSRTTPVASSRRLPAHPDHVPRHVRPQGAGEGPGCSHGRRCEHIHSHPRIHTFTQPHMHTHPPTPTPPHTPRTPTHTPTPHMHPTVHLQGAHVLRGRVDA